jgi:NTE family protein
MTPGGSHHTKQPHVTHPATGAGSGRQTGESGSSRYGTLVDNSVPVSLAVAASWPSRMKRSFESVYRKVQDGGKSDLFQHAARGTLRGLVLPFLGQNDEAFPIRPPNLVPRDAIIRYPTNFSPMSEHDIALITKRGEQLTRLLID